MPDLTVVHGLLVTTPERTAWDLGRRLPLVDAVVAVDALAGAGGFHPAELLARRLVEPGARGCRRLDRVVALADPRAESPPETRLRVGLVLGGLPQPEVQYEVLDEYGFHLARADLAYEEARLAIEYDGVGHFSRIRHEHDRERDALPASHGWLTVRLFQENLKGMPQTVGKISAGYRPMRVATSA